MLSLRLYIFAAFFLFLFISMALIAGVASIIWIKEMNEWHEHLINFRSLMELLRPVSFYVILNATVFAFTGTILIGGKILKPVEVMINQADKFRDSSEETFFIEDRSSGMGRLSRAMNSLIQKREQDRDKLAKTVKELKEANIELEKTRNEMIRTEKLASVGRLAAGLAHEIGNPLGILSGYLSLLEQPEIPKEEKRDFIQRAKNELNRIDTLIRRLLAFARPRSGEIETCSLNSIVNECIKDVEVQPMFRKIQLDFKQKCRQDSVRADALQLRQVILNCLLNSADAINSKNEKNQGKILIHTEKIESCDEYPSMVKIELIDNGTGIKEEDIHSVFDPFFTTKEIGKGTGLGLSVCYMIVRELKGEIKIKSKQGEGTSVSILLPFYN